MKTRISKRILSALLAALMVITSVPLVVTAATTDAVVDSIVDAHVVAANNQMDAFDEKLATAGASFVNVEPAYNAYVAVQKAIDSYYYGTASADSLDQAVATLKTYTDSLQTFDGFTVSGDATNTKVWSGDNTSNYSGYKNVLWIDSGYTPAFSSKDSYSNCFMATVNGKSVTMALAYPSAVLLYDGGTNTPATSVMCFAQGDGSNTSNANRYLLSFALQDTNGMELLQNWRSGHGSTLDHTWNMGQTTKEISKLSTGLNGCTAEQIRKKGTFSATAYTYYYSNMFTFTGTMTSSGSGIEYSRALQPTIKTYINSTSSWSSTDDANMTVTGTNTLYVVNANAILTALKTNGEKMKEVDLGNYSEGSLLEYIQAMDAATAFDFESYFSSKSSSDIATAVSSCTTAMKAIVKNMNNADTDVQNSEYYENLRVAMEAKMATARSDGSSYTNFDEFMAIWQQAQQIMDDVLTVGYTQEDDAQSLADQLNAFEFETSFTPVDTATLEATIDSTTVSNLVDIYTPETYDALMDLVTEAKIAIWGGDAEQNNYPDVGSLKPYTEENQAEVDSYTESINLAIRALRVDPSAVVVTSYGRYSLNSAIALSNTISDPTDYANFATFTQALNDATLYIASAQTTETTNFYATYSNYVAQVEAIIEAYNSLQRSFTKLENGTIAKDTQTTMTTITRSKDGGTYYADFDYPSSNLVFRTTHDEMDLAYGTAHVSLAVNESTLLENHGIDSISINATQDGPVQISSTWGNSTPNDASSSASTYPGCLSYNGFSLSNFKVTDTQNNLKTYYGRLADGTQITDAEPADDAFATILGTSDFLSANPGNGVVAFAPSKSSENGSITLAANMNIHVDSTAGTTLTRDTYPTSSTYTLSGTYFGMTYLWNVRAAVNYSGFDYVTSKQNSETIESTVTVLDISNLVDLVAKGNEILNSDSAKYTDNSFQAFVTALEAAQANMDYKTLNAATILQRCKTRYQNLWDAIEGLEVKQIATTFSYVGADGKTTDSTVINITYGKSISDYADEFNAIVVPSYTSEDGLYTYTANGTWSPDLDLDAAVIVPITYTAQYDESINNASFVAYNNALSLLLGKLADETYPVSVLEQLSSDLEALTYVRYSDEQKAALLGTEQSAINAETATIESLSTWLDNNKATLDISAAKGAADLAKTTKDNDVYDVTALDLDYTKTVSVLDNDVVGLVYGTQAELDAQIANLLQNINKVQYTIYLNGVAVGTAEYGENVIVGGDGTFVTGVADLTTDQYDGSDMLAWKYSYASPSRNNVATEAKYLITAKSLGFVVKGDTYLTTSLASASETGYTVKFATNDGKVFDVQYTTDGTVTVPSAPSYAFYNFTGYEGGYTAGSQITVDADTTIVANYTPDTSNTYQISFYVSKDDYEGMMGEPSDDGFEESYAFNELVELEADDAYCWVSAVWEDDPGCIVMNLLAYGPKYSFYACKSYASEDMAGIVALTEDDYKAILADTDDIYYVYDGQGVQIKATEGTWDWEYPDQVSTVSVLDDVIPVYDSDNNLKKVKMVGTFTLADGYSIVECGVLFSSDLSADLTVENVDGKSIARMKASSYTCGNQFAINVNVPSSRVVSFKYVGYAVVADADGNITTLYSKAVPGSTQGL
jgi:hypothetical protein